MSDTLPLNDDFYEPLSERELEILSCLDEGLTNQAIATRLHLAIKTVKWYNTQIYARLNVRGRKTAVMRAKQLGLLNDGNRTGRHNLPAETKLFIGRKRELNEITQLLESEKVRLITILAPGGMGKTQLAMAAARQQLSNYVDGIFFVSLSALKIHTHLAIAIATTLDLQFQAAHDPTLQLLDFLRDKQMLLILDNFEHLLEGAALATEILEASASTKILVTSREKLSIQSEYVYDIHGMERKAWTTVNDALGYESVQLFLQSTQVARTEFVLDSHDVPHLSRICQLIDGMPLGLVLSAAWIDVLSLAEIADEIQRGFDFLAVEMRDLPHRHWSIRAVFDPTWERLTDHEKSVFMKFSIFRGGCTREAAQSITEATLHDLQALINKALLIRTPEGRYEIHELIRQYAKDKLIASDEEGQVRDNHCAYYLGQVADCEEHIWASTQRDVLSAIEIDIENVRSAWKWAYTHEKLQLIHSAIYSLYWVYWLNSRYDEAALMFHEAANNLKKDQPTQHRRLVVLLLWTYEVICHCWRYKRDIFLPQLVDLVSQLRVLTVGRDLALPLTYIIMFGGLPDFDEAKAAGLEVLQNRRLSDNPLLVAASKVILGGMVYLRHGRIKTGKHYLHEAMTSFEALNSPMGITFTSELLGRIAEQEKDFQLASNYYLVLTNGWKSLNGKSGAAGGLISLGYTMQCQGQYDEAKKYYRESMKINKTLGLANKVVENFIWRGYNNWQRENYDTASRELDISIALARELNVKRILADALNKIGHLATSTGLLPQAKEYYIEAFQLSYTEDLPIWILLESVSGLANLRGQAGYVSLAQEWLSLVYHHPQILETGKTLVLYFLDGLLLQCLPADNRFSLDSDNLLDLASVQHNLLAD